MTTDRLADFLAYIPIGYYRLDAQDRVADANTAWLELHGYQHLEQVQGRNIHFAYVRPQEAEQLREKIRARGMVKDEVYELVRPNGEHFWASIYSIQIIDEEGQYAGREGIVHDVTERQIHHRIMNKIPLGYYAVEMKDGTDTITYCNQVFADMFGFASPQAAVGVDLSRLYRHRADYEKFLRRIQSSLENYIRFHPEVQTIDGQKSFWIEANTNVERNAQGDPVGRVGIVRDFSQDIPITQLRKDLGNVLHTFTTALIAIKSDMEIAHDVLGSNLFPNTPQLSLEQLHTEMSGLTAKLRRSLTNLLLLATLAQGNAADGLNLQLRELLASLEHAEKSQEVFRAHTLYDTAWQIADACQSALDGGGVPHELLKQVRQDAYDLMSVHARFRLQERISDVLQMDHDLRSLRAYVTTPSHEVESLRSRFKLWPIVELAMRNLLDFARSRGVTFRPATRPSQGFVLGNEPEILRVVMNLLHNAIKYSWSREAGTWVEVRLYPTGQMLSLEIENFGVPIPADEIDSGLIYLFGYRSRNAMDRGRVGTGIGLADATETLRRYGGAVELRSRPAFSGGQAEQLDPFLTTAIMTIPIAR